MNLTKLFLKAKHWQLFLITIGLPIILHLIFMAVLFTDLNGEGNFITSSMMSYMGFSQIVSALSMGILLGWFWSIAIGLQSKVPTGVKMKVTKFKIFFFIPIIYIIFFLSIFIPFSASGFINSIIFIAIVPLHLLSMFGMLYSLYFVAKTFKTVELQRKVSFSDFAGEFFLIWFFPIGIWIVQPKINKMIEDNDSSI